MQSEEPRLQLQKTCFSISYRVQEQLSELKQCAFEDIEIGQRVVGNDNVHILIKMFFKDKERNSLGDHSSFSNNLKKVYFLELEEEKGLNIQFLLVIHPKYPLSPPLLLCTTRLMFPRLDDYRDYLEDVLKGQWWPAITIKQIVQKLYSFISLSKGMSPVQKFSSFSLGSLRNPPFKHDISIIKHYSPALKLFEAEVAPIGFFVGSYKKIIFGLSWSNFITFEKISATHCVICQNWPLMSIKKIEIKRISKRKKDLRKIQSQEQQSEENYEIRIKFFNSKIKDRMVKIKDNSILNEQEPRMSNIQLNASVLEQNKSFQIFNPLASYNLQEENSRKKKFEKSNKIQMLRHMAQFVQLRQFIKNSEQTTQYKTSMISQAIQKIAQENNHQLLQYYRRKLKQFISIEYGCWELTDTDNATIKFDFD